MVSFCHRVTEGHSIDNEYLKLRSLIAGSVYHTNYSHTLEIIKPIQILSLQSRNLRLYLADFSVNKLNLPGACLLFMLQPLHVTREGFHLAPNIYTYRATAGLGCVLGLAKVLSVQSSAVVVMTEINDRGPTRRRRRRRGGGGGGGGECCLGALGLLVSI